MNFHLVALLTFVLVLPAAAEAQNFLTVRRVSCTPISVTDCKTASECRTRAATERDKALLMVIDFAQKRAFARQDGKDEAVGPVLDERIEGGLRRFAIREGDASRPPSLALTLAPGGKLLGEARDGKHRFEAACSALR
jgi:hypothetical protein